MACSASRPEPGHLFAYGTLLPPDADGARRGRWQPDAVRGRLYDLGPYPALIDLDQPGADWVSGQVRPVSERELLEVLDPYEDVGGGLYGRASTRTRAGRLVWVYVYLAPLPQYAIGPLKAWSGRPSPGRPISDSFRGSQTFQRPGVPVVATATHAPAPARDGANPAAAPVTIGQYLIDRLYAMGIRHIFGIPGDYILGLYKMLEDSPIEMIGMTREDAAGFAADAYARINGLGAVAVTYCVGGLSTCNSIAGAYAEKSPVVVLTGSPGMGERARDPMLHHKVRNFDTQFEVYEKLTVASTILKDPLTAFLEIDRVLGAAVRYKRPVYIEVPRDMITARQITPHVTQEGTPPSDPDALREALDEAEAMIRAAKRPVILADVEIHRFGLQDDLIAMAEEFGVPVATTILGKSVISEAHPLFAGVYEGAMGREDVTRFVEDADCLLLLGFFMTDINLGIFTAQLEPSRSINATSEDLRIRHHHYRDVRLEDFLRGLRDRKLKVGEQKVPPHPPAPTEPWKPVPKTPLVGTRVFERINQMLDEKTVVIADVGEALFGAVDLRMNRRTEFISPAYYTSMGFAMPAAVGAGVANRQNRPLVLVGDGAFQMTGMELSTIVRQGLNPIVVVLNNKGYTTERFLLEGSFNDIQNWAFHKIPEVLGTGLGLEAWDEEQLDKALKAAVENTGSFSLINVHLDPYDRSPTLDRLAKTLAKRVRPPDME
ncbi:MAG: thiamine pyrophosphate-binding protein [Isosphaeraceae bacterium]